MLTRCDWANVSEQDTIYHDSEWGVVTHDDTKLFETLFLETMQAGLSWSTILRKRRTLRDAYDHFNYQLIAQYQAEKVDALMLDTGVIRHKRKIEATISNAQAFMNIQNEFGSFDNYIWQFVDEPLVNHWTTIADVPATTALSDIISKDLKKRGFKFVGSTTIYAFMQAIGMVDDHVVYCFKHQD
jgi:DNA-3-methyladenine glycosylase I